MGIALDKNNSGVGDGSKLDGVRRLRVGLSWDSTGNFMGSDLDLSAVVMQGSKPVRVVSGKKNLIDSLKDGSLVHSGDNTTGAGDGDDETIDAYLDRIEMKYTGVIFIVTAGFKAGLKEKLLGHKDFSSADNVEFQVYDMDPGELETVSIMPSLLSSYNACLIAKVSRTDTVSQFAPWQIEVMEEMVNVVPGDINSLIRACVNR
ncbi:TerD family protein [Streptomyces sp. 5-10]|uniref:TerD family protein n=1 Tax=Streptomyces sp. 5-10 TaxID=878925 RepID=UPI00168BF43E|nr:TerD family protein [Streptomyces sp. 5-10]MBD3004776.1 TerD family protein [Streptomyces sp. 5-10]